jgi:hypothetical protein
MKRKRNNLDQNETAASELSDENDRKKAFSLISIVMCEYPDCNHSAKENKENHTIQLEFDNIQYVNMIFLWKLLFHHDNLPRKVSFDIKIPSRTDNCGIVILFSFYKSSIHNPIELPEIEQLQSFRNIDYKKWVERIKGTLIENTFSDLLKKDGIVFSIIKDFHNIEKYLPCIEIELEEKIIEGKHKMCMIQVKNLEHISSDFFHYLLIKYACDITDIQIVIDRTKLSSVNLYIKKSKCKKNSLVLEKQTFLFEQLQEPIVKKVKE